MHPIPCSTIHDHCNRAASALIRWKNGSVRFVSDSARSNRLTPSHETLIHFPRLYHPAAPGFAGKGG